MRLPVGDIQVALGDERGGPVRRHVAELDGEQRDARRTGEVQQQARLANDLGVLLKGRGRVGQGADFVGALIERHGVEGALEDVETRDLVDRIIRTGAEYEKTHEQYEHGIRSTPTMIINNRMVIGTLPYEQLRAIFAALINEHDGQDKFLENWVDD